MEKQSAQKMEARLRRIVDKSDAIKADNYQDKIIQEISSQIKGR